MWSTKSKKCAKCAGNHLSADCALPKESPAKCSNCGEAHPANYRGCVVAKELQKRRDAQLKKQQKPSQKTFTSKSVVDGVSYSQAATTKPQSTTTQTTQLSLEQMMQKMMTRIEELSQRLTHIEARDTGAIPRKLTKLKGFYVTLAGQAIKT